MKRLLTLFLFVFILFQICYSTNISKNSDEINDLNEINDVKNHTRKIVHYSVANKGSGKVKTAGKTKPVVKSISKQTETKKETSDSGSNKIASKGQSKTQTNNKNTNKQENKKPDSDSIKNTDKTSSNKEKTKNDKQKNTKKDDKKTSSGSASGTDKGKKKVNKKIKGKTIIKKPINNKKTSPNAKLAIRSLQKIKSGKGSYGSRGSEKVRLEKAFGSKVDGNKFEAEHILGVKVLTMNADKSMGAIKRTEGLGKQIERNAGSYFEVKELHKAHPGTGSGAKQDNYRKEMASLVGKGQYADALVKAVKEYGNIPNFKEIANTKEGKMATDSFNHMLKSNPKTFAVVGQKIVPLQLKNNDEKVKVYLARQQAINGRPPTQNEINAAKKFFND